MNTHFLTKIKNRIQIFLATAIGSAVLAACGGGSSGSWSDVATLEFKGATRITPNPDGTWTLWWPSVPGISGVTYRVFQRAADQSFDFKAPLHTTVENTYVTSDLRLKGNTCFVVRFSQDGRNDDANVREVCTLHEAYRFEGLESLASLRDGSYLLKWKQPPFQGARFQVYSLKGDSGELLPLALTDQAFFKTKAYPLSDAVCFVVRHRIEGFPEDTNDKKMCTTGENSKSFAGVEKLTSPKKGSIGIEWLQSNRDDVAGYRIYLGSDFSRLVADVAGRENTQHTVDNLYHGVTYTFGVRAYDIYGREDANTRVLSFDLTNHLPTIQAVRLQVVDRFPGTGRPRTLKCVADYEDVDEWQSLKPTFYFKNRRPGADDNNLVERPVVKGVPFAREALYLVQDEDKRLDKIRCEVVVNDGFDDSLRKATQGAEEFEIPDTRVVAEGFRLDTVENTPVDIVIARRDRSWTSSDDCESNLMAAPAKPCKGYADFDRDNADKVHVLSKLNGDFVDRDGNIIPTVARNLTMGGEAFISLAPTGGGEIFSCVSGICTARFKPAKDFYTDANAAGGGQLATFLFRIEAGNSVSQESSVAMAVRALPQVTGLLFTDGQQDHDLPVDVSLASGSGQGYTHVLGYRATKLYLRARSGNCESSPISVGSNGQDLPDDVPTGCTPASYRGTGRVLTATGQPVECHWGAMPSCEIPCSNTGTCSFIFRPKQGWFGDAVFEYSVVVGGLSSAYGNVTARFKPNLQASGLRAYTVEGFPVALNMAEGAYSLKSGFSGSKPGKVVVTRIVPVMKADNSNIDYRHVPDAGLPILNPPGSLSGNAFVCSTTGAAGAELGECTSQFEPAAGSSGRVQFDYQVKAEDKENGNAPVTSDMGQAEITVISRPRPTGMNLVTMEFNGDPTDNGEREFAVGSASSAAGKNGYYDPDLTPASRIQVTSVSFGTLIVQDENGAWVPASPSDATPAYIRCSGAGLCPFKFKPNLNHTSQGDTSRMPTMRYRVFKAIPSLALPPRQADAWNAVRELVKADSGTGEYEIRSLNAAEIHIDVRSRPRLLAMNAASWEGEDLVITVREGVANAQNGSALTLGYAHVGNMPPSGVRIENDEGALLAPFDCSSGVNCTARFRRSILGVKELFMEVSVNDPVYAAAAGGAHLYSSKVPVRVDVRKLPVATGLLGEKSVGVVAGESTLIKIKNGFATGIANDGYIFKSNAIAAMAQVGDLLKGTLTGNSSGDNTFRCNQGVAGDECHITYYPLSTHYGSAEFNYTVRVNEVSERDGYPSLGEKDSRAARVSIDVRPGPVANGIIATTAEAADTFNVVMTNNQGFFYPYIGQSQYGSTIHIKEIRITAGSILNMGKLQDFVCVESVCTGKFRPNPGFSSSQEGWNAATNATEVTADLMSGNASFRYRVVVEDPLLHRELVSNEQFGIVRVLPKPRLSNPTAWLLQGVKKEIALALGVNGSDETLDEYARQGYTHPFGLTARGVQISNVVGGTFDATPAPFGNCNGAGRCSAFFTPANGIVGKNASFQYKVKVSAGGVDSWSDPGTYLVNARPRPVANGALESYMVGVGVDNTNTSLVALEGVPLRIVAKYWQGNDLQRHTVGYTYNDPDNGVRAPVNMSAQNLPLVAGTMPSLTNCNPWAFELGGQKCEMVISVAEGFTGSASFDYRLAVADAVPAVGNVESDWRTVTLNIRGRPHATSFQLVEKQGLAKRIELALGNPGYSHTGNLPPSVLVVPASSVQHGALYDGTNVNALLADGNGNFVVPCAGGRCAVTFRPALEGVPAAYYFGDDARFQYKVLSQDAVLGVSLESELATATVRYRPMPVARDRVLYVLQDSTLDFFLKKGPTFDFDHPYLDPQVIDTVPFGMARGNLNPSQLSLSAGCVTIPTFTCGTRFTPEAAFFGEAKFNYTVSVYDEIFSGTLTSSPALITVHVKPKPIATGRQEMGVQDVARNIRILRGKGFSYPEDVPFTVRVVSVENGSVSSAAGPNTLVCDAGTRICSGTLTPGAGFVGKAKIRYTTKVDVGGTLGIVESNEADYEVELLPRPVVQNLQYEGEQEKTFGIALVGGSTSGNFCANGLPANSPNPVTPFGSGGSAPSYVTSARCLRAEAVTTDSPTNLSFVGAPAFSCDSDGVCRATVSPAPPFLPWTAGRWKGFDNATFNFSVTVAAPTLPTGADPLSADELAALTSAIRTATVKFYPVPKATGLAYPGHPSAPSLFLYAVQDQSLPFTIGRCNDMYAANCSSGYVQGYNEPATAVSVKSVQNLNVQWLGNCDSSTGDCSMSLTPASGYYSSGSSSIDQSTWQTSTASFNYTVTVHGKESSQATANVVVYPVPQAARRTLIAKEGKPGVLILTRGAAAENYKHPFVNADKLYVLDGGANLDFTNLAGTGAEKSANCTPTQCEIHFTSKATSGSWLGWGETSFLYRLGIPAPLGMSPTLAEKLKSGFETVTVKVLPRPTATGRTVYVHESVPWNSEKQFLVRFERTTTPGVEKGYYYPFARSATDGRLSRILVNGGVPEGGVRRSFYDGATKQGEFKSVEVSIVDGDEGQVYFEPMEGYFGTLNIPYNLEIDGDPDLRAASDNLLNIGIRPIARKSDRSLTAIQGESVEFLVEKGAGKGYTHPIDDAGRINLKDMNRGTLTSGGSPLVRSDLPRDGIACTAGKCGSFVYAPPAEWTPRDEGGENLVTIKYTVETRDALLNSWLESDLGAVTIDYRPRPRAIARAYTNPGERARLRMYEGQTKEVVFSLGTGYSHPNGLKPTDVQIGDGANGGQLPSAGTVEQASCDANGECRVRFVAAAKDAVNGSWNAGFSVRFKTLDSALAAAGKGDAGLPAGYLWSNWANVTLEVLELPRANDIASLVVVENNDKSFKIENGAGKGFTHGGGKGASSIELVPTTVGAESYEVVGGQILTDAFGNKFNCQSPEPGKCYATFRPTPNRTDPASFKFRVRVSDPDIGEGVSPNVGSAAIAIRPAPKARNVSITTAEDSARKIKVVLGEAYTHLDNAPPSEVWVDGHAPSESFPSGLGILGGKIDWPMICKPAESLCEANFTPSPGYTGEAWFRFKVKVFDATLGELVATAGEGIFTIDIRPRPKATGLASVIAVPENISGLHTSVPVVQASVELKLNNTAGVRAGYSHLAKAPLADSLPPVAVNVLNLDPANGALGTWSFLGQSAKALFLPASEKVGNTSFDYHVSVRDPVYRNEGGLAEDLASLSPGRVNLSILSRPRATGLDAYWVEGTEKVVSLARGAGLGYTHPTLFATSVWTGTTGSECQFIANCNTLSFDCSQDGGTRCEARALLSGSWNFPDIAKLAYYVNVTDPNYRDALGLINAGRIESNLGYLSFRVRPVPKSASPATVYVKENEARQIVLSLNNGFTYADFANVDADKLSAIKSSLKLTVKNPTQGTINGGTSEVQVSCQPQSDASWATCPITFTPAPGVTGTASFEFKVSLSDPYVGKVLESTWSAVPIEIRPRPHTRNLGALDAPILTNRQFERAADEAHTGYLTISMSGVNGADPVDGTGAYTYARNTDGAITPTIRMKVWNPNTDELKGSFFKDGIPSTATTVDCEDVGFFRCRVPFKAAVDEYGPAKFYYSIEIDDPVFAIGDRVLESKESSEAWFEIYPKPVCRDVALEKVQGDPTFEIPFRYGSSSEYSARAGYGDKAIRWVVEPSSLGAACAGGVCPARHGAGSVTESVNPCDGSGTCTASFTLNGTYYTGQGATADDVSHFQYRIASVKPDNLSKACWVKIRVKPRPVLTAPTQLWALDGRAKSFTVPRAPVAGTEGYFYPIDGMPVTVNVKTTSASSVGPASPLLMKRPGGLEFSCQYGSACFVCSDGGACSTELLHPQVSDSTKLGTDKGAQLVYSVTIDGVESNTITLPINVRGQPRTPGLTLHAIEGSNTAVSLDVGNGISYIGNGSTWDIQRGSLAHIGAATMACPGNTLPCLGSITPEEGFNRTIGAATFRFRVKVTDPVAGDVWSSESDTPDNTWGLVRIYLAPRPIATNVVTFANAIQGTEITNDFLQKGSGWTHVEPDKTVNKINVASCTNCSNLPLFTCNVAGTCATSIVPVSSFGDLADEPVSPSTGANENHTGKKFGWAKLQYKVSYFDTDSNLNVESANTGNLWVYFRPVPQGQSVPASGYIMGLESTPQDVTLQLTSGYTHPFNRVATDVLLRNTTINPSTFLVLKGTPSCNATGVCSLQFKPPATGTTYGQAEFKYDLQTVDNDGFTLASNTGSNDAFGTVRVYFRARPRVQDLSAEQASGGTVTGGECGVGQKCALESCDKTNLQRGLNPLTFAIRRAALDTAVPPNPTETTGYYSFTGEEPNSVDIQGATAGSVTANSCLGGTCSVTFTPSCLANGVESANASFSFKATDATGLQSSTAATANFRVIQRMKATGLTIVQGPDAGVVSVEKVVSVSNGNGYTHALAAGKAGAITLTSLDAGLSVAGCASAPCTLSCDGNGVCSVPVTSSLSGARSFTYWVEDTQGFRSRNVGTASVFFSGRPVVSPPSDAVYVASNTTTRLVIQAGAGAGYTHEANYPGSAVTITDSANLNGTLTAFSCDAVGVCKADYTPTTNYASTAHTSPASFTYKVRVTKNGQNVDSSNTGVFKIDVFPRPTVANQPNVYLKEDQVASVNIARNVSTGFWLRDNLTPSAMRTTVSSGSGVWTLPLGCSGDTCAGTYSPTSVSTSAASLAVKLRFYAKASFTNAVGTEPLSLDVESATPGDLNIYVKPKPTTSSPTVALFQGETRTFCFTTTEDNAAAQKVVAYSFAWPGTPGEIRPQTALNPAVVTVNNAFGTLCGTNGRQYSVTSSATLGVGTFTFLAAIPAGGGFPETISDAVGTTSVRVDRRYRLQDVSANGSQINMSTPTTVSIAVRPNQEYFDDGTPAITANTISVGAAADCVGAKYGRVLGTLSAFSTSAGTFTANFVANAGSYGDVCFPISVGNGGMMSDSKTLRIVVTPADRPPMACEKNTPGTALGVGNSVIIYPGTARTIVAKRGGCGPGEWYNDEDPTNDQAVNFEFVSLPTAGAITGCGAAPCTLSCTSGECSFTYTGPATAGNYSFRYRVRTYNATMNTYAWSHGTGDGVLGMFQVVTPPTPVAVNTTTNGTEDDSQAITVAPGVGYKTPEQMNLRGGPEGFYILASDATISNCGGGLVYSSPVSMSCLSGANAGTCSGSIAPAEDWYGTTSCKFTVEANGVASAQATWTINVAGVDDPPQTHGKLVADRRLDRHVVWDWPWWGDHAGLKNTPVTVWIRPRGNDVFTSTSYDWTHRLYGYNDREGQPAKQIRIPKNSLRHIKSLKRLDSSNVAYDLTSDADYYYALCHGTNEYGGHCKLRFEPEDDFVAWSSRQWHWIGPEFNAWPYVKQELMRDLNCEHVSSEDGGYSGIAGVPNIGPFGQDWGRKWWVGNWCYNENTLAGFQYEVQTCADINNAATCQWQPQTSWFDIDVLNEDQPAVVNNVPPPAPLVTPTPDPDGNVPPLGPEYQTPSVSQNSVAMVLLRRDEQMPPRYGYFKDAWQYRRYEQMDLVPYKSTTPVTIPGLETGVSSIDTGEMHFCVKTTAGAVKCWGFNEDGRVGDGTTFTRPEPVDVINAGATQVALGSRHSCALVSGGVKCWGRAQEGELGNGTFTVKTAPQVVSGLTANVTQIASGGYSSCARLTDGTVKCWGWNQFGQLGDGTTTNRSTPVPVCDTGTWNGTSCSGGAALSNVASISVGYSHACARLTDGTMKCWGRNNSGQLGDNTQTNRPNPVFVKNTAASANLTAVSSIALGGWHTCAINTSGALLCWGEDARNTHWDAHNWWNWGGRGRLGLGNFAGNPPFFKLTPQSVIASGVTSADLGLFHTCAIVSGGAKCWGRHSEGQLGTGASRDNQWGSTDPLVPGWSPMPVSGLTGDVGALAAGGWWTCGIVSSTGTAKCWGGAVENWRRFYLNVNANGPWEQTISAPLFESAQNASGVVVSNMVNGSVNNFMCIEGFCLSQFTPNIGYIGPASFNFQVRTGEGVIHSRNGSNLSAMYSSALVKLSKPGTYNLNVQAVPLPTGRDLSTNKFAPVEVVIKRGTAAQKLGFTHALNKDAKAITVEEGSLVGGTLTSFDCATRAGECFATFTPTAGFTGDAGFNYYVTDTDSRTSVTTGHVTILVNALIEAAGKIFTGITQGQSVAVSITKAALPLADNSGTYGHRSGLNATSLVASGFVNGAATPLTGAGVSCTGTPVSCTVTCTSGTCSFTFVPTTGNYADASLSFVIRDVNGEQSAPQTLRFVDYVAYPTLPAQDLVFTGLAGGIQGQAKTVNVSLSADGLAGYAHPFDHKATAIRIVNASATPAGYAAAAGACGSDGVCAVTFTPPANATYTTSPHASFRYEIQVDGLWTQTSRKVVVEFREKPVATSIDTAMDENTTKVITLSKANGAYAANTGNATEVRIVGTPEHGRTVDGGGATVGSYTCSLGSCDVRFVADAGYAGNAASFIYKVVVNGVESDPRTVRINVDGKPVAANLTATTGHGEVAQPIVISLGNGYTDPNGDGASSISISSPVGGAFASSPEFVCQNGICMGQWTPNHIVTTSSFQFQVTTRNPITGISKTSANTATVTIPSIPADDPPVATGRNLTAATRSGIVVTIQKGLGLGYTDPNSGDQASEVAISFINGGRLTTPFGCAGGTCTATVAADAAFYGQVILGYKVKVNEMYSNLALVTIDLPAPPAAELGCISGLAWGSAPSLDRNCWLSVPATATLNTCTVESATAAVSELGINEASLAANGGGFGTYLADFAFTEGATSRSFATEWSVQTNWGDAASMGRRLSLQKTTPASIARATQWATPSRGLTMAGIQQPYDACTGDCKPDYGAATLDIATKAGAAAAVGRDFACTAVAGGAKCWGANALGQIGDGTALDRPYAADVNLAASGSTGAVVALAAGKAHACALLSSGEVACWGDNGKGQLGDGTTTLRRDPVLVKRDAVTRLTNVVSLAAGDEHTCAVTYARQVWCWGLGNTGQTGVSYNNKSYATLVTESAAAGSAPLAGIAAVTAGSEHTCMQQLSVDGSSITNRRLLCMGTHAEGELGAGVAQVGTTFLSKGIASSVSNGDYVNMTSHGLQNGDAVMFTSTSVAPSTITTYYVKVRDANSFWLYSNSALTSLVGLQSCSSNCGSVSVLRRFVPDSGFLVVGDGVRFDGSTTVPTGFASGTTYFVVDWDGTSFGLATTPGGAPGQATSRGSGVRLTLVNAIGPKPVLKDDVGSPQVSNAEFAAAGGHHTCYIDTMGGVFCFGRNDVGQLGIGIAGAARNTAAQTLGLNGTGQLTSGVVALTAGSQNVCALRTDKSALCWGGNGLGQLGNNAPGTNSSVPRQVVGTGGAGLLSEAFGLAAGNATVCAIVRDATVVPAQGILRCWGDNSGGQLGDATTTLSAFPAAGVKSHAVTTLGIRFRDCSTSYTVTAP